MNEAAANTEAFNSRPELLQVAETVARDKGIERDEVLEAMEQATCEESHCEEAAQCEIPEKTKKCAHTETTLMLHGIPSYCSVRELRSIFACLGFTAEHFDWMHLPTRVRRGKKSQGSHFGYMFLNCVTPEIAQLFALAIKHHPLGRKDAMCERVYCSVAKVQGVQANISAKSGTVKNFMLVKDEDNQWQAVKCSALDYAA